MYTGAEAKADITGKQFCAVKHDGTTNQLVPADTAGENVVGVLQDKKCLAGRGITVMTLGFSKIAIGATDIVAGKPLAVDANGKFVHATSGQCVAAFARENGAANTIGTAFLTPYNKANV